MLSSIAALLLAGCGGPSEVEWKPESAMDNQFFPAFVIATSSMPPVKDDDQQGESNPYLLGDKFGMLGVSIKVPSSDSAVKVTIKENNFIAPTTWSGTIPKAKRQYFIAPKVNYKLDRLPGVTQQAPLNVDIEVEVNGKSLGQKTETLQVHSINDCPYGVAESEDTVDYQNAGKGSVDLGWMYAAYVNENYPRLDKILQEAMATKVVDKFDGYEGNDPAKVLKQVFAIWTALEKKGVKYNPIAETPGGAPSPVKSQFVRFLDQSIDMPQASCIDGSVLFASLLRKIGIDSFLVGLPHHMYVAFYLTKTAGAEGREYVGLETTMLGQPEIKESNSKPPDGLVSLQQQLSAAARSTHEWKSFAAAVLNANDDLDKNQDKFDSGDPDWQTIDIAEARDNGIMPISAGPATSPTR